MPRRPHPAFAAWLRDHLDARGWSAADLAARVGDRPPSVYHWTAGAVTPLDPQVAGIAEALALDPSEVWAVLARDGVTPFGGPTTPRPTREPVASPADRPFPRWLRRELETRGGTPRLLARVLGIHPKTVNKWATGTCPPVSVHIERLADALDVDPATIRDLLSRADSEESH
jgi:transcriptional regulator with XRE-family HTH domain